MSLVKWTRPEIEVATNVDRRVHVSQRITWRDVLSTVGRFEMDLRRAHANLRATDRRALTGKIDLHLRVNRRGRAEIISAKADEAITDMQPYVVKCLTEARFPESAADMEVRISCMFDSGSGHEDPFAQAVDPFEEPNEDPFSTSYAAEAPQDDPGFGDPF